MNYTRARHRLPDKAQFRPEPQVYAESDFFYDRDGLKGIAVFVDGSPHDEPARKEKDSRERGNLEDMGYRVIVIRYDKPIQDSDQSSRRRFRAWSRLIIFVDGT